MRKILLTILPPCRSTKIGPRWRHSTGQSSKRSLPALPSSHLLLTPVWSKNNLVTWFRAHGPWSMVMPSTGVHQTVEKYDFYLVLSVWPSHPCELREPKRRRALKKDALRRRTKKTPEIQNHLRARLEVLRSIHGWIVLPSYRVS